MQTLFKVGRRRSTKWSRMRRLHEILSAGRQFYKRRACETPKRPRRQGKVEEEGLGFRLVGSGSVLRNVQPNAAEDLAQTLPRLPERVDDDDAGSDESPGDAE